MLGDILAVNFVGFQSGGYQFMRRRSTSPPGSPTFLLSWSKPSSQKVINLFAWGAVKEVILEKKTL